MDNTVKCIYGQNRPNYFTLEKANGGIVNIAVRWTKDKDMSIDTSKNYFY